MITLVFGLPGSGKTTLLTKIVLDACKSKKYKNVYCNVDLNIPYPYYRIHNKDVGKYSITDGLVAIDEAIVFADNRSYKTFIGDIVTWFVEHRHDSVDIWFFSQSWDALDKRIRQITDRAFYIFKTPWTGWFQSKYYRIPYGIIIPDPKKNGTDKLGEIIQGYCKPNILVRLFCKKIRRRKYYKFFDSWQRRDREPLPEDRLRLPEGSTLQGGQGGKTAEEVSPRSNALTRESEASDSARALAYEMDLEDLAEQSLLS